MEALFKYFITLARRSLFVIVVVSNTAAAQVLLAPKLPSQYVADALSNVVRTQQKRYVRESTGPRADQCFTDDDLDRFRQARVVDKIVSELRKDQKFVALISNTRALSLAQRTDVFAKVEATYKPTWAQLGRIDRLGQTDAGQQAEREIASAVVGLVKESM